MLTNLQSQTNTLGEGLVNVADVLLPAAITLIFSLIVVALGFLFGGILGRAVKHLFVGLKIDNVINKAGLNVLSERSGVKLSAGAFVGGLIKWVVILGFAAFAADMMGLQQITQFLQSVLQYIPNIFVAAIIIVISTILADFVTKVVTHSSNAAGFDSRLAAHFTRYAILTFGVLAALVQLGIASSLLEILFTGIVAALSIALGLAFGLGGKEHAARFLDKLSR